MTEDFNAVLRGSISQRQAAAHYGVPRATLQKIIAGRTHVGTKPEQTPNLGQLESKLVHYAVNRAALGLGFGKKTVV
jgi:hypothetical protein